MREIIHKCNLQGGTSSESDVATSGESTGSTEEKKKGTTKAREGLRRRSASSNQEMIAVEHFSPNNYTEGGGMAALEGRMLITCYTRMQKVLITNRVTSCRHGGVQREGRPRASIFLARATDHHAVPADHHDLLDPDTDSGRKETGTERGTTKFNVQENQCDE